MRTIRTVLFYFLPALHHLHSDKKIVSFSSRPLLIVMIYAHLEILLMDSLKVQWNHHLAEKLYSSITTSRMSAIQWFRRSPLKSMHV